MEIENTQIYTAKDFASDQDVKWCPGCGDYSILNKYKAFFLKLESKKRTWPSFQELAVLRGFRII